MRTVEVQLASGLGRISPTTWVRGDSIRRVLCLSARGYDMPLVPAATSPIVRVQNSTAGGPWLSYLNSRAAIWSLRSVCHSVLLRRHCIRSVAAPHPAIQSATTTVNHTS